MIANVYAGEPDARQEGAITPSRFRPRYRALTTEEFRQHDAIKDAAMLLELLIGRVPQGRETALAMTKLEEAVMWAVKGLTA